MTTEKQLAVGRKNAEKKSGKAAGSRALVKKMTPEDIENIRETLTVKITPEELRLVLDFVKKVAYFGSEPEEIMARIAKVWLLPPLDGKNPDKQDMPKRTDDFRKALMVYGLDTHFPLSETIDKEYRPQVIEFSRQLIREYDCKTSGEKALAETVVSAYARILKYSRCLNGALAGESTQIGKQHIEYYLMLSKELDRANRHFIIALTTLKQFKVPSLEISVKAKTAFVAQNQQINATNNLNAKENEIVDHK